ncbi:MAG: restriction endonuclease subunit S, partial [Spirochaetia bacterium]|nr:restriction endonuclease subunit S [Spirochaetia bacterium]
YSTFDGTVSADVLVFRIISSSVIDNMFLYFLLCSPEFTEFTVLTSRGAKMPRGDKEAIKSYNFMLPTLPEQKAIAGVLSSLDDKIDLLHRQNQTLEAMAETLFRQWFIEEAEDDWEEVELSTFGKIICGKTPSKKKLEYFNNDIPFIKIPDMHQQVFILSTTDNLSFEGQLSQDKKTIPKGSICVSCIATVGLVSMTSRPSQTNQQINSIIPNKDHYRYFLYLLMKSYYDLLHAMASGGTATLNLNTGDFSRIKGIKPPEEVLIDFHNAVNPCFEKIFHNQNQIQLLQAQRDTLLPKLMSGEVRVEF